MTDRQRLLRYFVLPLAVGAIAGWLVSDVMGSAGVVVISVAALAGIGYALWQIRWASQQQKKMQQLNIELSLEQAYYDEDAPDG